MKLKRDRNDTKELMELIIGLNKSVKSLSGRFDQFSNQIEGKVNRLSSEMVLLRNKVDFIERNFQVNPSGSSTNNMGNMSS